jgi:hypothetical protein
MGRQPRPGRSPHTLPALSATAQGEQAFLGNRDPGGMFIGNAGFAPQGLPGAWSLTATIPANVSGGQQMFVNSLSSASGQEAIVSILVVVGESLTDISVPTAATAFCPTVMQPTPQPTTSPQ